MKVSMHPRSFFVRFTSKRHVHQRPGLPHRHPEFEPRRFPRQFGLELRGEPVHLLDSLGCEFGHRDCSGCTCRRITIERARMIERAGLARIEAPYNVLTATESAGREAATDDLAHHRKIGMQPE